jgi:ABC-type antimicrobial peptide transport system permease subunit
VADARYINLWELRPAVYLPVEATGRLAGEVLIRTSVPPAALLTDVQRRWRAMSPGLRMSSIRGGDDHVRVATESQRLAGQLVAVFSVIALLVASIGLYSAMAWVVERRQREIAIRIAIGGSPTTNAWRVVLRAAVVAGAGTALGLGAAVALAPQLAALSRSTSPYDAVAIGGSVVTITAICVIAAAIPAVRAGRVDPALVLRGE